MSKFCWLKNIKERKSSKCCFAFHQRPLAWEIYLKRGEASLDIYFFSWCHITLDLTQAVLIVKSIFGEYSQNFCGLKNINWRKCSECCFAFHQSTPCRSNSHQERGSKHLLFCVSLNAVRPYSIYTNSKKLIWWISSKVFCLKNLN